MFAIADCNNFYCSCERVFRPDLEGRPVVVLSNNDGCIVSRSNESKALGIKMGEPLFQAMPTIEAHSVAVFSSNYNLYGDMSKRVMSLLSRATPHLEIYSIDEAFLDLSGIDNYVPYCHDLAAKVKKCVGIPISIGIAPTRTLAKVASKFAKKYPAYKSACAIDTDDKRQRALQLFDVADVWGIGRRMAARLKGQRVFTAYDFTQKSASWVKHNFHVTGLRTWQELRGQSCVCIDDLPHKQSICTSRSFPAPGLDQLSDLEEAVSNFAAACARKLREQHTAAGAITVFAYTNRFRPDLPSDFIQATAYFEVATSAITEIVPAAIEALHSQWKEGAYIYKKAGVLVWNICPQPLVHGSLFDEIDRDRQERLLQAIDSVNRLCGHDMVRTAVQGYSKKWHIKTEYISRQFTTNIQQIIRLKV